MSRHAPRNETELVGTLMERIRDVYGGHCRKVHGSRFQAKGEPDIVACLRGRAVHVEVKMPGERPDPAQYAAMRRWQAVGALVGWVTSVAELDELLSHVADLGWANPQLAPGVGVERIVVTGAALVSV